MLLSALCVQDEGKFVTFYLHDVDAIITSIINNSDDRTADGGSTSSTRGHTLTNVEC